jgi:hypothetical protein
MQSKRSNSIPAKPSDTRSPLLLFILTFDSVTCGPFQA